MLGLIILVAAFVVFLVRRKMKPSTRTWLVVVFALSVTAVTTAGISWDSYIKKEHGNSFVDTVCFGSWLLASCSVFGSFGWSLVLVAQKRWEESLALFVALLIAFYASIVCDSSWPILR